MPDRPHVLYIMTDQQSGSAMSCAGNGDLHTPVMDSLAASGTRFANAYCSFPLCLPARGSMVTSRMPHEFGITGNAGELDEAARHESLGHLLGRAGYDCAYAGKTHLPQPHGADTGELFGWQTIGPWHDPAVAPACIDYLRQPHDRPFFLCVSYDDPHNICEWARQQALPYGDIDDVPTGQCPNLPANFLVPPYEPSAIREMVRSNPGVHPMVACEPDHWRHYRHAYFRLIERVDRYLGQILETLHETGLADNTLVIFSSDHGDGHGAHQLNQKSFLYDEQARVPFIVRPPGGMSGRVDDRLVNSSLDLLPTICDYAGIDPPSLARGRSVRPLVEDQRVDDWREAVFCETVVYGALPGRMVRTPRYKYAAYLRGWYREQLFDMEADPGEMVNLAVEARYADVLQQHRELLRQWCEATGDNLEARWGI